MGVIFAQFPYRRACRSAAAAKIINDTINALLKDDDPWRFDDSGIARLRAEYAGARRRDFRMIEGGLFIRRTAKL